MLTAPKRKEPIIVTGDPLWMPEPLRERKKDIRLSFRFSEAERRVYRRRKKIPVSEWAERHRVVTMGSLRGRWKNSVTPYGAGIMDASFFPSVQTVILCKSPQVGGTEFVNNCIAYVVDRDPGPVLDVYPDEQTARENSKDRILPMIQQSRRLRSYLTGMPDDEAAFRINLQHMQIYMAWARSAARLANKPIKYAKCDEIDKYPDTANKRETSPILLAEKRTIWYRLLGRKIWKLSTPTVEAGPIWVAMTTEAQVIFDYYACCPDCGEIQLMAFKRIKWPEDERDPERIESRDMAWYECRHCKSRWGDHKRDAAVRWGQWRARTRSEEGRLREMPDPEGKGGEELFEYLKKHRPRKIAFHIPAWLSHFVGLSEIAAAFLKGHQDKNKLKDFKNNYEALPWKDYTIERQEDRILKLRDDRPRGRVPSEGMVSCLTAGVDTQDYGFWYEIRAWGYGPALESWQVREGYIDTLDFEILERILFHERYHDAEEREYFVRFAVQDAMGHKTSEVYDFARRHRGRLLPFQGKQDLTQPYQYSQIDYYPPDSKGRRRPIPGGLRLLRVNVTYYKNLLAGKLEVAPDDPGAWHLHGETTEEYARHMCAEYTNERGYWEVAEQRPNHFWDCGVLNLVAAEVIGVKFLGKPDEEAQGEGRKGQVKRKVARSKFMSR